MTPFARALAITLTIPAIALFGYMIRAVIVPVLLAALFAIMLSPLTARIARRLRRRGGWAPALVTLGALCVILVPTIIVVALVFQELRGIRTSAFASSLQLTIGSGIRMFQRSFGWLSRLGVDMSAASLRANVEDWAQAGLSRLGDFATEALTQTPDLIIAFFLFVISFYFWLRDGQVFTRWLKRTLPFPDEDTETMFVRTRDAAHGVVVGQLFTGGVQAGLALIFLFALSVPGAFLWGVLAFVLSFIPLFGTTPVTLGASVYLFSQGRSGAGIVMLVGLVLIGSIDNVIRPMVASGEGHMHPLLSLVAIFGGLATIGAAGIFLGPVIAALALWSLDFFGREKARTRSES